MCGLVGYSGAKPFDIDKLKLLLYMNSIERGKDATGIYTPKSGILKDVKKAEDFLSKLENFQEDNLFIGHVRARSVGDNTVDNAHPYQYGDTIGVHNGTLTNHWLLCNKHNLPLVDYNTDSQVIISLLNKYNNFKPFSEILGSAAVIVTKEGTNELFFYRNSERPLFRGKIDGGMYLSSLENGLKMIGCTSIMEVKEDFVYQVINGEIVKQVKVKRAVETKSKYVNFSNSNANDYLLVDRWLECDMELYHHNRHTGLETVKKGKFYRVKSISSTTFLLNTVDEEGNDMNSAAKTCFNLSDFHIEAGHFVVAMANLSTNDEHKIPVARKGQLFLVTDDTNPLTRTCRDMITLKNYEFKLKHIRRAKESEILWDEESSNPSCALNDYNKQNSDREAAKKFLENYKNNQQEEEEEEDEDEHYVEASLVHDVIEDISKSIDQVKDALKYGYPIGDLIKKLEETVLESYSTITESMIVVEDANEVKNE